MFYIKKGLISRKQSFLTIFKQEIIKFLILLCLVIINLKKKHNLIELKKKYYVLIIRVKVKIILIYFSSFYMNYSSNFMYEVSITMNFEAKSRVLSIDFTKFYHFFFTVFFSRNLNFDWMIFLKLPESFNLIFYSRKI